MTDSTPCPKCGSEEWFPGAACWHCGWEGSADDAYKLVLSRIEGLELTGNPNAVNCDAHGPSIGPCPACELERERAKQQEWIDNAVASCARKGCATMERERDELRENLEAAVRQHHEIRDELKGRVTKMRAALERIANLPVTATRHPTLTADDAFERAAHIAREATR